MLLLAVIPESLSVVGSHDDRGRVVQTSLLQLLEQVSHDLVRERDLAVVRIRRCEPFRRRVGLMRFIDVKKEKESRVGGAVQPLRGRLERGWTGTLHVRR